MSVISLFRLASLFTIHIFSYLSLEQHYEIFIITILYNVIALKAKTTSIHSPLYSQHLAQCLAHA